MANVLHGIFAALIAYCTIIPSAMGQTTPFGWTVPNAQMATSYTCPNPTIFTAGSPGTYTESSCVNPPSALVAGQQYTINFNQANPGMAQLTLSAVPPATSPVPIKIALSNGTLEPLAGGEIVTGLVNLFYDGTEFVLTNPESQSIALGATYTLSQFNFTARDTFYTPSVSSTVTLPCSTTLSANGQAQLLSVRSQITVQIGSTCTTDTISYNYASSSSQTIATGAAPAFITTDAAGHYYMSGGGATSTSNITLPSFGILQWSGADALSSTNGHILQLGGPDSMAPVTQALTVQNVANNSIANTAGVQLTLAGSRGTGSAKGGYIYFQTSPANDSTTVAVSSGTYGSGVASLTLSSSSLSLAAGSQVNIANVTPSACVGLDGAYTLTSVSGSPPTIVFTASGGSCTTVTGGSVTSAVAANGELNAFVVDPNQHVGSSNAIAPTLPLCGTGPSTVKGSDNSGNFNTGTSPSSCTMQFYHAYTNIPTCLFQDMTGTANIVSYAYNASTPFYQVTLTFSAGLSAAQSIQYICQGINE